MNSDSRTPTPLPSSPAFPVVPDAGCTPRSGLELQETSMKSIILWLCGVPIGVIILLKVFGVF